MKHLLIVGLLPVLIACSQQKTGEQGAGTHGHSYSSSYRPPAFTDDQRKKLIRDSAALIRQIIEIHAARLHIPGVAYGIVVDDELVVKGSTGLSNLEEERETTTRTCFRIASMTKGFTAMAILKLRDEGRLSLDDPAEKYIPEMSGLVYPTSDAPAISIEDLLTMTAGLPEDNPWGDRQLDEPDRMLLDLLSEGISFSNPPSFAYEYSNTGYALLGLLISRVSGLPYQDYIREHIFMPLGMNHTYWEYDRVPVERLARGYRWEDDTWKPEPMLHDGAYGAMGGIITTIEDFSKYVGYLLYAWPPRNGPEKGPVRRSTLREMQTPQYPQLYSDARDFRGNTCAIAGGYGFGLSIYETCNGLKIVTHSGALPGFGSDFYLFPDYGVGVLAFCNLTYTDPMPFDKVGQMLFESIGLPARTLPVSDILAERQEQVARLIESWDPALEREILAENFYLDRSREHRMEEVGKILDRAGPVDSIGNLSPQNQLRGSFEMHARRGVVEVFFTLTPESDARVQYLDVSFQAGDFN